MTLRTHMVFFAFVGLLFMLASGTLAPSPCGADALPKPTYDNTFYFYLVNGYHWRLPGETAYRPEWESYAGTFQPWMAEEILKDMLRYVGPPGPYARIGTAESIWPLLWVDPLQDWSYSIAGGAASGAPVALWREAPGAPLCLAVPAGTRDHGLHLYNLVLDPLQSLGMPLVTFVHGYNTSPQRWENNAYDPAIPLDLTAYLEITRSSCMEYEDGKITICDNMNGIPEPWDYVEDPLWNGNGPRGTYLTLSRLLDPGVREAYVHRNYRQAYEHILQLQSQYPGVITAVTVDPEVGMNNARNCAGDPMATDFSPSALSEWREWLQHAGIYDDQTGQYAGDGCPDNDGQGYPTLELFNQLTGSSFTTWDEVDPRSPMAGQGLLDMYLDGGDLDGFFSGVGDTSLQGWCEVMVDHFCEDLVAWGMDVLQTAGWNEERLFTHQLPGGFVDDAIDPGAPWGYQYRMPPLIAAQADRGSVGITGFRWNSMNGQLFGVLRDSLSAGRNWGHFEWNPISYMLDPTGSSANDYEMWMGAFDSVYSYGCHHLAAYRWWVPPELEPWSSIWPYEQAFRVRGEPVDFEARLEACYDFIQSIRFQPFSAYNGGPGAAPDYDPPPVGGATARYLVESGVRLRWSPLIWPDVPQCYWYDTHARPLWPGMTNVFGWPDFTMGRFEIYRDTLALFQPGPDNFLASVSNRDSTYTDSTTCVDRWYYYKVLARDNDGTLSSGGQTLATIPEIALNPTSLADTIPHGAVVQDTIRVTNQGSFPLVFQAWLEEQGGEAPSWAAVVPQADTLLPGASTTIELSLGLGDPDAGDYDALLLMATNDPYHRLVEVPVELTVEGAPASDPQHASPGLSVTLRPNPACNSTVFHMVSGHRDTRLDIYDASGRLVDRVEVPHHSDHERFIHWRRPPGMPAGLYFWRATSPGGSVSGKLVLIP
jgi:hypothetical protein